MNEKISNLVNEKLNNIFNDYPDTKDLRELHEELESDLIASAEDKLSDGISEETAVKKAFDSFGDIDELITQVLNDSDKGKFHINDQRHGHHIDIDDNGIKIDNGKMLNINDDGITINGGKTIEVNEDGIKLGNMTIDENGINFGGGRKHSFKKAAKTSKDSFDFDFDEAFDDADSDNDTEIYVESLKLTDKKDFVADDIKNLDISYDNATVKILPTSGNKIIIREYMSRNNPRYQVKTSLDNGTLKIIQGEVPHFLPLKIRAQILIPDNFQGDAKISSHSGDINIQDLDNLRNISIAVHSGLLNVRDVKPNNLAIKANSGKIILEDITTVGDLLVETRSSIIKLDNVSSREYELVASSGTIKAVELSGAGNINAKSGSIKAEFAKITGDIAVNNISGTVKLTMPNDSYNFDLEAQSGTVKMGQQANFKHDVLSLKEGTVGDNPQYDLTVRVKSGTIKVN